MAEQNNGCHIGINGAEALFDEMLALSNRMVPHDFYIYRDMFVSYVAALPQGRVQDVRAHLMTVQDLLTRAEVMHMCRGFARTAKAASQSSKREA